MDPAIPLRVANNAKKEPGRRSVTITSITNKSATLPQLENDDGWAQVNTEYDNNPFLDYNPHIRQRPARRDHFAALRSFEGCALLVFKSAEPGLQVLGHSSSSLKGCSWENGCVAVTCSWNKGAADRGQPPYLVINIAIPKTSHGFGGLKECDKAVCDCGFCGHHNIELRFFTGTFQLEHQLLSDGRDGTTKRDMLLFANRVPAGDIMALRFTMRIKGPWIKGYPFPYLPGSAEAVDLSFKVVSLLGAGQWTLYYPAHESHEHVLGGIGRMFAEWSPRSRSNSLASNEVSQSPSESDLPTLPSIFATLARSFNHSLTNPQLFEFISDEETSTVLMRHKVTDFDLYSFFLKLHNSAFTGRSQKSIIDAFVGELLLQGQETAQYQKEGQPGFGELLWNGRNGEADT